MLERGLVQRALGILEDHRAHLGAMRAGVLARYEAGLGPQTPVFDIDMALLELDAERVRLDGRLARTRAVLNTLLGRGSEQPLEGLALAPNLSASTGEGSHPELASADAHIQAAEVAEESAGDTGGPSFGVFAQYNSMLPNLEHQVQVGAMLELPLHGSATDARVDVAAAQREMRIAERDAAAERLSRQAAIALATREEATSGERLLREQLLPTARARHQATLAGFDTGTSSFTDVVQSLHQMKALELRILLAETEAALAELERRRALGVPMRETAAELDRAQTESEGTP